MLPQRGSLSSMRHPRFNSIEDSTVTAQSTPQRRPYFKTKAEWARYEAGKIREQIRQLRYESSGGSRIKAARKYESLDALRTSASRYEQLASQYEEQGI